MAPTPSPAPTQSLTSLHADIFYHILEHLGPTPRALDGAYIDGSFQSWSDRNALACLARSNSIFTRPALAAMWRTLPNTEALEHLLCVVGIAQRPLKQDPDMDMPPLELCGTLETHQSGWMRFQEYASLVREIVVNPALRSDNFNYHTPPLEDTFWFRLSSAFGITCILPRLEVASIQSMDSRPINAGELRLLNPSIRELDIILPWTSKEQLKRFQRAFKDCVPSLQNLEVLQVGVLLEGTYLDQFLDIESLPSLHPRLRTLKLDHFYGAAIELYSLRHLSTLRHLEDLTVQVSLYDWEPASWSVTFQALRSLTVFCDEFLVVGTFLAHIDVPQLRTISVSESYASTNTMAQELAVHLHTLVAKCPALTTFSWQSVQASMPRIGYLGTQRLGVSLAKLVAPLLVLRTMQRFHVSFSGPAVPYTPTDLRTFAEAWPGLEAFRLYDDSPFSRSDEERYADIESIIAFARDCPRLRRLHLPIVRLDLSTLDTAREMAGPPTLYSLRALSVHDVDISRPEETGSREQRDYKEDARHFRTAIQQVFTSETAVYIETESAVVLTVPHHDVTDAGYN